MTLLPFPLVPAQDRRPSRPEGRRRPVKITARWLTSRANQDGSRRFYFQPRSRDVAKGWPSTVALRDEHGGILRDPVKAAAQVAPLAALYDGWLAGLPDHGPDRLDLATGTVRDPSQQPLAARQALSGQAWAAGTIGAIVADYEASRYFLKLAAGTQADYRYTNGLLVEAFGPHQWRDLSESDCSAWIEAVMAEAPSMGHQLYRQSRAVLGKARLIYKKGAPGHIPKGHNPFAALDIETPDAKLIVWTEEIIPLFVAHCDAKGAPSFGDAALFMSWIGTRRNDWSRWPADFFDRAIVGFRPRKTRRSSNKAVVIPWTVVPALRQRIEAANARLEKIDGKVRPATFFYDDSNNRPWTEKRFGARFRELRDSFAAQHPAFRVHYFVDVVPGDPFLLPSKLLTARSWRHTCVTLLLDKGTPPDQIVPITGHTLDGIKTIEKNYRALTAAQAAGGLAHRTRADAAQQAIKEAKG